MTRHANYPFTALRRLGAVALAAGVLGLGFAAEPANAVDPVDSNTADLNDDGVVNIFDFSLLGPLFGKRAGEAGYREGLDLNSDGIIDADDLRALIPFYLQPADTDPTRFCGRVYDNFGNPLPSSV